MFDVFFLLINSFLQPALSYASPPHTFNDLTNRASPSQWVCLNLRSLLSILHLYVHPCHHDVGITSIGASLLPPPWTRMIYLCPPLNRSPRGSFFFLITIISGLAWLSLPVNLITFQPGSLTVMIVIKLAFSGFSFDVIISVALHPFFSCSSVSSFSMHPLTSYIYPTKNKYHTLSLSVGLFRPCHRLCSPSDPMSNKWKEKGLSLDWSLAGTFTGAKTAG